MAIGCSTSSKPCRGSRLRRDRFLAAGDEGRRWTPLLPFFGGQPEQLGEDLGDVVLGALPRGLRGLLGLLGLAAGDHGGLAGGGEAGLHLVEALEREGDLGAHRLEALGAGPGRSRWLAAASAAMRSACGADGLDVGADRLDAGGGLLGDRADLGKLGAQLGAAPSAMARAAEACSPASAAAVERRSTAASIACRRSRPAPISLRSAVAFWSRSETSWASSLPVRRAAVASVWADSAAWAVVRERLAEALDAGAERDDALAAGLDLAADGGGLLAGAARRPRGRRWRPGGRWRPARGRQATPRRRARARRARPAARRSGGPGRCAARRCRRGPRRRTPGRCGRSWRPRRCGRARRARRRGRCRRCGRSR